MSDDSKLEALTEIMNYAVKSMYKKKEKPADKKKADDEDDKEEC